MAKPRRAFWCLAAVLLLGLCGMSVSAVTLSGQVKTFNGQGVYQATVQVERVSGTVVTDSHGNYSAYVADAQWAGAVTVVKAGCVFRPASRSVAMQGADTAGVDFQGGTVVYVNPAASGTDTGDSWANAYRELPTALQEAAYSEVLWVAAGTYVPGASRFDTFRIPDGVALFGGFAGTESTFEQRNVAEHPTSLSGDIGAPGDAGDNVLCVVTPGTNSWLADCTVKHGMNQYGDGGGVFCDERANVTVEGCTIVSNSARNGGGVQGGTLVNCVLAHNSCVELKGWGGGARYASLRGCLVYDNQAWYGGGGLASCTGQNVTVVNNSDHSRGGGVYAGSFENSIVVSNTAPDGANFYVSSFAYSCTLPQPGYGAGNIAQHPKFANYAQDVFRLFLTSPCINAGLNQSWMTNDAVDLLGAPRILGATVDMGAYEWSGTLSPAHPAATQGAWTNRVALTWEAVPNAQHYSIWRSTPLESGPYVCVAQDVAATTWDDYSMGPRQTGYYGVASFTVRTNDVGAVTAGWLADPVFRIETWSSPGGAVTPTGTTYVGYGSNLVVNIVPDADYHVEYVLVDGISEGAIDQFAFTNVVADHTLYAQFAEQVYTVQVVSVAGGCSPEPGSYAVTNGDLFASSIVSTNFVNGFTQYWFSGWSQLDGTNQLSGTTTSVQFAVETNVALTWEWLMEYWCMAAAQSGGTVTVSNAWYDVGDLFFAQAKPVTNTNFAFSHWSNVNDGVVYLINPYSNTVTGSLQLLAAFAEPLAPPDWLAASTNLRNRVELSWGAVPDATGYQVWRSQSNDVLSAAEWTNLPVNISWCDTAVQANTYYYYWLKTLNQYVTGDFSCSTTGMALRATGIPWQLLLQ